MLQLPSIAKRLVFNDGYSKLDFTIESKDAEIDSYHAKRILMKRDEGNQREVSPIVLQDLRSFFTINITLGTPEQDLMVTLGTSVSDTWVNRKGNPYCQSSSESTRSKRSNIDEEELNKVISASAARSTTASTTRSYSYYSSSATLDCERYGTFNEEESETFNSNHTTFQEYYRDRTTSYGEWGTDTLKVGDFEIENYSFGLAYNATLENGVLGLGFEAGEGTNRGNADPNRNYTYSNFPSRLKDEGYISKKAYSLYLDSYNSTTGSVLFGAIDHAKYSGSLVTLPAVNIYEDYGYTEVSYFTVTVSGVGTSVNGNETTFSSNKWPALVESGTTLTYLPTEFIEEVAESFNATYSYYYYAYVMDCPTLEDSLSQFLVFDLSGHKIFVPLFQLIKHRYAGRCVLGIYDSFDGTITLGANFLRSVYTVFDLEDREVSFAQANYTEEEDIEIIESSIPSATRAPDYSNTYSGYQYASTTQDIFSDVDDGTTAVDVFGYTGGELTESYSFPPPITRSRTTSTRSSSRTSRFSRSTTSIGRSTLRAGSAVDETTSGLESSGSSSGGESSSSASGSSSSASNAALDNSQSNASFVLMFILIAMTGIFTMI